MDHCTDPETGTGRVDVISRASGKFADRVDSNICRIMERNRVCIYINWKISIKMLILRVGLFERNWQK